MRSVSAACSSALCSVVWWRRLRDFTFDERLCSGFWGRFCNALCQPAANLYVTRTIPASRRALALALKQSAIPGRYPWSAVSPYPLVALTIGWRWSFVICAAAAARDRRAGSDGRSTTRRSASSAGDAEPNAHLSTSMLLLATTIGLGAAGCRLVASRRSAIAGAARIGMPDASAGWLVAFGSGLAIATRISLGYRADYRTPRSSLTGRLPLLLGLGSIGALGLISDSLWVFTAAVPVVFSAGWGWPGLFNFAVIKNNSSAPGAATGFTQTGTYLGAALGPMLFGFLADGYGWTVAWSLVSIFLLLAAGCAVIARTELRRWRSQLLNP